MAFADAYLRKAGLREKLIQTDPHPDLKIIVTIPVYNESGLERCLDSLFSCHTPPVLKAEVLLLINAPDDASREILEQNLLTRQDTHAWTGRHKHPHIDFHLLPDQSFPKKEAGVGLARKILMDEAVRRFNLIGIPDGIIASMDADTLVESNYLEALLAHFELHNPDGCSIYFEHPLTTDETGEDLPPLAFTAVSQYELHLRYFVQAVRFTGYPYAYHTVGSSFAVRTGIYSKEGGMNRRQGGEDFYFIQKIAQRGNWSNCATTRILPSPRPSDRVPFGTGPVVSRYIRTGENLLTYNPELFPILKAFFEGLVIMYNEVTWDRFLASLPSVLREFLEEHNFVGAIDEIRGNSASYPAFRKRFWRWFNMFRIMKFLHYARKQGYPDIPLGEASLELLSRIRPSGVQLPDKSQDLLKLLHIYRRLDWSAR